jgi:hypothetical protein
VLRGAGRFSTTSFPLFHLIDTCLREPSKTQTLFIEFLQHNAD